jgi:iron complex outermembrane receptor protein
MLKLTGPTWLHCLSILMVAVLSLGALTAHADTAAFAIEPQALSGALKAFAVQSHREIFFAPELVRGRKSNGVKGKLDDLKALNMILEGTGLNFSVTTSNAILVHDPTRKTESSRESLPPTTSTMDSNVESTNVPDSRSKEEEKAKLDTIVVTGTHIAGVAPTSPLVQIDQLEIAQSGYTTTAEVLGSITQNFSGTIAPTSREAGGSTVVTNIGYSSGVDLRGLGDATLSLATACGSVILAR